MLPSIGEIQATTAAGSLALRNAVRSAIWGGPVVLPEMYQTLGGVEGEWSTVLGRVPYYAEWQYWKWNAGGVPGALGMACRTGGVYFQNSSKLAIVHAGHNQGLLPPHACPPDFDALIKALAASDCDMLILSMPWMGNNLGFHLDSDPALSSAMTDDYHWIIGTGATQGNGLIGSRLRYFLDPVIAGMERSMTLRSAIGASLGTTQSYSRIAMIGHSGGGWTATLVAAVESRITHSYAIAGSVPFGHRAPGEGAHDWEQREGIQELGLDYHDLYLMAAAEPARKARVMYNGGDTAFKSYQVNGFAWPLVQITKSGGYGNFRILVDTDSQEHAISTPHRSFILSEFCA